MLRASAGSIGFVSIYGPLADTPPAAAPYAYYLEVDGVGILLDCGWNDGFDVWYLEKLRPFAQKADIVLLSNPELRSCGALPFVIEQLRPGVHVVTPSSTAKIGIHGVLHPFLYQFPNTHTFAMGDCGDAFTLTVDKIYSTFRSTREPFGGKVIASNDSKVEVQCNSIFTGRMIGGHGWIIKYQIDELLYCPDFSVKPSYALKRFVVPTTANIVFLQSYPLTASLGSTPRRFEDQLQALFKEMQQTLRCGSDVLIPVNVAGRGLEILSIVVRLLQERGGDQYKVVFAAVQAQELLDKVSTVTELLRDEVILSDQNLFSNVITCRTAEDVTSISGAKVIVADGETLDYGIAAELLEHILPSNVHGGGEHLIVFPQAPYAGTNAYAIATAPQGEGVAYAILRRMRLSKEELEEHFLQLEHEVEERRRALEREGTFRVTYDAGDDDDAAALLEDDDDDAGDIDPAAAGSGDRAPQGSASAARTTNHAAAHRSGGSAPESPDAGGNTLGLTLPPYLHFKSRHLHFPTLDATNSISAALMEGVDVAYGLPVHDDEQLIMQQRAPARGFSDAGPEALQFHNDAQQEANVPSKVFSVSHQCGRYCRVYHSDLSGQPDASTIKNVLKSRFTFAKKIVSIRGNSEDWRLLGQFCRAEKALYRCAEGGVSMPQGAGVALELATQVLSYEVRLDPGLEHAQTKSLRRVRESTSKAVWEVGWVNGELRRTFSTSGDDGAAQGHEAQRRRLDEGGSMTLTALNDASVQSCAEERERKELHRGSFFVGDIDLGKLKDSSRRDVGLLSEFHKKAPMLVFDEGVCVRKGGSGVVTLASIASPAMFDIRKSVYRQFSQTL